MATPARSAACRMVSPRKAWTGLPSRTNSTRGRSGDFIGKVLLHAAYRVRRRLAQAADGSIGHDLVQVIQGGVVPMGRLHQLGRLRRAHAAGRALAAAFGGEEPHGVQ